MAKRDNFNTQQRPCKDSKRKMTKSEIKSSKQRKTNRQKNVKNNTKKKATYDLFWHFLLFNFFSFFIICGNGLLNRIEIFE